MFSAPAALSNWLLHVGDYLDVPDLASCETAKLFCPEVQDQAWHYSAARYLSSMPPWGPRAQKSIEKLHEQDLSGKQFIFQVLGLARSLMPPEAWQPWIQKTSFHSVRAIPFVQQHSDASDVNDGEAEVKLPHQASIAIATGVLCGSPLVVCVRVSISEGMTIDDAVCVGIEATGGTESGRTMSIMCAPFTGKCFIQHGQNGPTMYSQLLPELSQCDSVAVWLQVTGLGGIRFLRQVQDDELEEAGYLPLECLPRWVEVYYGCLHFWCRDLAATEANLSIEYSGSAFPSHMIVPSVPTDPSDTVWSLYGED